MMTAFEWMDRHPASHCWLVSGLIALAAVLAIIPLLSERAEDPRHHDPRWCGLLLAILVAGRWPSFFFPWQMGVDESQLLAGAHALTRDPVFWRSVSGGTAGPLDFFALWPAGWILGWGTFLTARVTALALLGATLVIAYQGMALIAGHRAVRIATLAMVCLEALTNEPDLLHYSTELLPMLLTTVAGYAAIRRWAAGGGPLWNVLGGLALGAVPLSKLQAVPLALVLGLCWVGAEVRSKAPDPIRRLVWLGGGAILPAALFAWQLTLAREWESFLVSYWKFNFTYAAAAPLSLAQAMGESWAKSLQGDSLLHFWVPAMLVWCLLMVRFRPAAGRVSSLLVGAAAAATLLSLGSIVAPHRSFLHYWQLFLVPGGFLVAALAARLLASAPPQWQKAERRLVAGGLLVLVGVLVVQRALAPNPFLGSIELAKTHRRSPLGTRVFAQARPGESLAVWGWTNELYVEANLIQATRDTVIGSMVEPGPLQAYYRERYLNDFLRNRPELFVDSVGPASLHYQVPAFKHDRQHAGLTHVIRTQYVLVEQTGGAEIYRRRDLVTP